MTAPLVVYVYIARAVYEKWHGCPKLFHIWNNIESGMWDRPINNCGLIIHDTVCISVKYTPVCSGCVTS